MHLDSALIQVQNNSISTTKKNIYILLSLMAFTAHQVPVSAFFCMMYISLRYFAPYTILHVTEISLIFNIVT